MIEEGIIINSVGVILVGLGIIVPFAVRRTNSPASFKVYVTDRIWDAKVKDVTVTDITDIEKF